MASTATREPSSLRAGTTVRWRREDLTDYPAPGWVLVYHLRNAGGFIDIAAAADGTAHAVDIDAGTSATYTPGTYTWHAFVSDGTDRFEVGHSQVEILPDVTLAAAHDGRVWARKVLDSVEAVLLDRATADQLDLVASVIGDVSMTRDRSALLELRSQLRAEARREEAASLGTTSQNSRLLVRFK